MKKYFNLKAIIPVVAVILIISVLGIGGLLAFEGNRTQEKAQAVEIKPVADQIVADGTIGSENEATLHFQIGGKLTYLAAKEGDKVYQGETLASLDTYALQKQLQIAANAYESAKNNNDTTHENESAGILEGQTRISLDTTNKNSYSAVTEAQVITDTVKRIVDNSDLTKDTAALNVELANYALQLSRLTSPIGGTLVRSDLTVPNVNITPVTSFTVANLNSLIFKANIRETDIANISEGMSVEIRLSGMEKPLAGTIKKIYPVATRLSTGESAYRVDIESSDLAQYGKYGQSGTVVIKTSAHDSLVTAPLWVVLENKYVWVRKNGKEELRTVNLGKTMNDRVQIISGLEVGDEIITDPAILASKKYKVL